MRCLLFVVMFLATAAYAQESAVPVRLSALTTAVLVNTCNGSSANMLGFDGCTGYILGVADQLSISGAICPGEGPATLQFSAVARKFLTDHPEKWDQHPAALVREALAAAFPCQ
jgi:hypothetical protein